MIKAIGLLGVIGLIFHIIDFALISYLFYGLVVFLMIVLWILLIIEGHQDKVLNEQAIQERKKNGED